MKNKDLFEAIDKIDDDLVNSAGKYLQSDGFFDADPVEVRPAARKISPVKIAAPIAAALAVVCGVTLIARTQRPSTYSPAAEGVGMTDSEGASSDSGSVDETSAPTDTGETSTPNDKEKTEEDLHKWDYLYDVDEKYLPVGFDGIKLTNADGRHYLTGDKETDKWEYGGFITKFVYYADPKGNNYNSADNPEAFAEGFVTDNRAAFKRIAKDDKFGSLTVGDVVDTTFCRDAENSPNEAPIYYYGSSALRFNGWLMIEDAYLVKSEDVYYCILRNGEKSLPIINATTLEDGSFGALPFEGNIGGLEYKTEVPPIVVRLRDYQQKVIDEYLETHSYAKVCVHIKDIAMHHYSDLQDKILSEGEVISIQSGGVEPKDVAAFINSGINRLDWRIETEVSVAEMKAELMEKYGFTDVRVYRNFSDSGLKEEFTEGNIILGNAVAVYDENGLCGIYTYGDYK